MRVTELLKKYGYLDDTYFTLEGSERGTEIHKLIQASIELGIEVRGKPEVAQAMNFLRKYNLNIIFIEERLEYLGISGTPDMICQNSEGEIIIVDFKSGHRQKWWGIQLQAYRWLLEKIYKVKVPKLWDVQLTWQSYRVFPIQDFGWEYFEWQKILQREVM